jgi:hypothetical protein
MQTHRGGGGRSAGFQGGSDVVLRGCSNELAGETAEETVGCHAVCGRGSTSGRRHQKPIPHAQPISDTTSLVVHVSSYTRTTVRV